MSGGSSDDAVLGIAHTDQEGRLVLDRLMDQGAKPPFDPRAAVERFLRLPPGESDSPRRARLRILTAERIYAEEMLIRRDPQRFHALAREMARESSGIYVYGPGDDY